MKHVCGGNRGGRRFMKQKHVIYNLMHFILEELNLISQNQFVSSRKNNVIVNKNNSVRKNDMAYAPACAL